MNTNKNLENARELTTAFNLVIDMIGLGQRYRAETCEAAPNAYTSVRPTDGSRLMIADRFFSDGEPASPLALADLLRPTLQAATKVRGR